MVCWVAWITCWWVVFVDYDLVLFYFLVVADCLYLFRWFSLTVLCIYTFIDGWTINWLALIVVLDGFILFCFRFCDFFWLGWLLSAIWFDLRLVWYLWVFVGLTCLRVRVCGFVILILLLATCGGLILFRFVFIWWLCCVLVWLVVILIWPMWVNCCWCLFMFGLGDLYCLCWVCFVEFWVLFWFRVLVVLIDLLIG